MPAPPLRSAHSCMRTQHAKATCKTRAKEGGAAGAAMQHVRKRQKHVRRRHAALHPAPPAPLHT